MLTFLPFFALIPDFILKTNLCICYFYLEEFCKLAIAIHFQVQLTVTPRIEGILKVVGVRWNLSDSMVGFHNFESNLVKKKIAKGRRKAKHSPSDNLKFLVIKVHALSCFFPFL